MRSFLLAQKFGPKDSLGHKTVNEINPWSQALKRERQIITRNESAETVKIGLALLSVPRKMFYLCIAVSTYILTAIYACKLGLGPCPKLTVL